MGTPDYMAPEIILRCGHGAASDWWSIGILLCVALGFLITPAVKCRGLSPWFAGTSFSLGKLRLAGGRLRLRWRSLQKPRRTHIFQGISRRMPSTSSSAFSRGIRRHAWCDDDDVMMVVVVVVVVVLVVMVVALLLLLPVIHQRSLPQS